LDRDNLGGLHTGDTGAVQRLPNGTISGGSYDTPAYFNGRIYYMGRTDVLKAFAISNGQINPTPVARTDEGFGTSPRGTPFSTTDGSGDGSVWVLNTFMSGTGGRPLGPAVMHAYDANDLHELWSSSMVAGDRLGNAVKFTVPTVVNGMVYVGTQSGLYVYGLTQQVTAPAAPSGLAGQSVSAGSHTTLSANVTWVSHSTTHAGIFL